MFDSLVGGGSSLDVKLLVASLNEGIASLGLRELLKSHSLLEVGFVGLGLEVL